ncbi:MAG: amino acid amidase [Clostridiales bacterium]|nr:amino acid amidase [Clostridiales bacterium]
MLKRIFVSSDIEGTCGIAHWDETEKDKADYAAFSLQMSKEVAAACEGAAQGGAEDIFVRDSHDSARNIQPGMLPENVQIFRGWGRDPYSMMSGIDETFSGVIFTGYHSAASWDGNPLSHTMNGQNNYVKINGEICSELMMNSLTAAMFGVPVLMVTGDLMLCRWFNSKVPEALTVHVSYGVGNGSVSIHPERALKLIRKAAKKAAQLDGSKCMFPMPEHFTVEVNYKLHHKARSASWYPGARLENSTTVVFESDKWMDVLTFFHYCL